MLINRKTSTVILKKFLTKLLVFFLFGFFFFTGDSNTAFAALINISGVCVLADGSTPCTDVGTFAVAIDGVLQAQTDPTVDVSWSITGVTAPAAGAVVTVFIDGAGEDDESAVVTKYDGSGDITGLTFIAGAVTFGSDDNQTISNTDIGHYDNDDDEDIPHTSNSGAFVTVDNEALVVTNGTYTPGGAVTVSAYFQIGGTVNGGSSAWSIYSFYISGGVFNSTSGTLGVNYGSWTHLTGGTFNHNSGTVHFVTDSATTNINVDSTITFNNLNFGSSGTVSDTYVIASGDTLVVLGTLNIDSNPVGDNWAIINTGTLEARGNVVIGSNTGGGTATISFLVAGDQSITSSGGIVPNINIDKPSGNVSVTGNLGIGSLTLGVNSTFVSTSDTLTVYGSWTNTAGGTFTHNSGTVNFLAQGATVTIDVTSTETFNNLSFGSTSTFGDTYNIASGDTLVALGTLNFSSFTAGDPWGIVNTGTLEARGNVVIGSNAGGGTASLSFTGTNAQTITSSGGTVVSGTVTINKASETVTLASNFLLGTSQAFTITSGTFDQGASYNFRAGAVTVDASGVWTNTGTGDVTLGGDVSNAGTITLNSSGGLCGDTDDIVLTSTNTSARTWSGGGTYTLYDLTVSYMSHASGLLVYSSTDATNNTNWTFASCGVTISGTIYSDEGTTELDCSVGGNRTVGIRVNGLGSYTGDCSLDTGAYSIANVDVSAGVVITVFLNGETEKAVTVTRAADSLTNIDIDLYQNYLLISHEDSGPVTNANLGQYDFNNDADVPFTSNAGVFNMTGAYTVLVAGNKTYAPEGLVTTPGLKLNGELDASVSNPNISVTGAFVIASGGEFTKGTGTLTFNSGTTQTITDSNGSKQDLGTVEVATGGAGITWCDIGASCNDSWLNKKKITFDNTDSAEELIGFPVLVALDSGDIDYAKVQNAGQDLRFVDSDDETLLAHEVETWNESGTSYVWVKVPSLDSASATDFIWLYYNNTGAADGQNASGVWDSSFKGAWHLNDNAANTTVSESTANGFDGTNAANTSTKTATGTIGNGLTYNGTTDITTTGDVDDMDGLSSFTVSMWANISSETSTDSLVIADWNDVGLDGWGIELYNGSFVVSARNTADSYISSSKTYSGNFDEWHHLTAVYDGSLSGNSNRMKYYLDGVLQTFDTQSGTIPSSLNTNTGDLNWGYSTTATIDEIRFSNSARSADWIEAEYNWTSSPDTYNTFGAELDYADSVAVPTTVELGSSLKISNLTIDTSQTVTAGSNTITLTGDTWANSGTFTGGTGTVTLVPTNVSEVITIGGSAVTTFYNFTATTDGTRINFKASQDTGFGGMVTIAGSPNNLIHISSDTSSTKWDISLTGTGTVTFATIQDSGCASGTNIFSFNDTVVNMGNNTSSCWVFVGKGAIVGGSEGGSGGGTVQSGGGSGGGSGSSEAGSGGGTVQGGGGSGGGGGASP